MLLATPGKTRRARAHSLTLLDAVHLALYPEQESTLHHRVALALASQPARPIGVYGKQPNIALAPGDTVIIDRARATQVNGEHWAPPPMPGR